MLLYVHMRGCVLLFGWDVIVIVCLVGMHCFVYVFAAYAWLCVVVRLGCDCDCVPRWDALYCAAYAWLCVVV